MNDRFAVGVAGRGQVHDDEQTSSHAVTTERKQSPTGHVPGIDADSHSQPLRFRHQSYFGDPIALAPTLAALLRPRMRTVIAVVGRTQHRRLVHVVDAHRDLDDWRTRGEPLDLSSCCPGLAPTVRPFFPPTASFGVLFHACIVMLRHSHMCTRGSSICLDTPSTPLVVRDQDQPASSILVRLRLTSTSRTPLAHRGAETPDRDVMPSLDATIMASEISTSGCGYGTRGEGHQSRALA